MNDQESFGNNMAFVLDFARGAGKYNTQALGQKDNGLYLLNECACGRERENRIRDESSPVSAKVRNLQLM